MVFTRPVIGTDIKAEDFGQPTYDLITQGALPFAIQRVIPAQTIAAGANSVISDYTYTVGPMVQGALVIVSMAYNAPTTIADCLVFINETQQALIQLAGGSCIGIALGPIASTNLRVRLNIYAWTSAAVTLDGTKSNYAVIPLGFAGKNILPFPKG